MKFFWVLLLLFLVSCSSTEPDSKLQKIDSQYRPSESREEYLRRMAIERYRTLRLEYLNRPEKIKRIQYKKPVFKAPPKEIVIPIVEDPAILLRRREDREVEIMQNIDLYCIKKQDSTEFNSAAECREFCTNILLDCENEVENGFERRDRSLVMCVKNKLSRTRI